jgi:hypothetical protein
MPYKVTVEEMRMALVERDLERFNDADLMILLYSGCTGYDNMTDSEIRKLYIYHRLGQLK